MPKRKRKNPKPETHARYADEHMESAETWLLRAGQHLDDDPGLALTEGVTAAVAAAAAQAEASHAGDKGRREEEAQKMVRLAGEVVLEALRRVEAVVETRVMVARNPPPPTGAPALLMRAYSTGLLVGNDEVYLVLSTDGEVIDAVETLPDDFGPLMDEGYGSLPVLELDVTGRQLKLLRKLARTLAKVAGARPAFRPGIGARARIKSIEQREKDERARASIEAARAGIYQPGEAKRPSGAGFRAAGVKVTQEKPRRDERVVKAKRPAAPARRNLKRSLMS